MNVETYHYTDEGGFEALAHRHELWRPSTGFSASVTRTATPFPGREDLFPPPEVLARHYKRRSGVTIETASAIAAVAGPGHWHDIHYGPGWYVTDLTPASSTRKIVEAFWRGDRAAIPKSAFWIKVSCEGERIQTPDTSRAHVKFLPIVEHRRLSGDPPGIWAQSMTPIYLVAAGCRSGSWDGPALVNDLLTPSEPVMLVDAFIFGISGFSDLTPTMQANLKAYFAISEDVKKR